METVLTELLQCVAILIAAFLTYIIRVYLVPYIESKMTEEQLETARDMASMFVYATEQTFGSKSGAEQKKAAKDALSEALKQADIEVDDDFLDGLIEAAVKGMKIAETAEQTQNETEG